MFLTDVQFFPLYIVLVLVFLVFNITLKLVFSLSLTVKCFLPSLNKVVIILTLT